MKINFDVSKCTKVVSRKRQCENVEARLLVFGFPLITLRWRNEGICLVIYVVNDLSLGTYLYKMPGTSNWARFD